MKDDKKKLYILSIVNNITRSSPRMLTMPLIIEALADEELKIDLEVLRFINTRFFPRHGLCLTPKDVAQFIAEIVLQYSPKKIIDPWANLGSLALPLHKRVKPKCLDAYSLNAVEEEI